MQNTTNDSLQLNKQARLTCQLDKKQKIVYSCQIMKYNDANKLQPRIFMITDIAVYNIQRSDNFIKSMMSKLVNFNKKYTIKRKIPFQTIQALTLSNHQENCQFVLHVFHDYDYRYRIDSKEIKKNLLKNVCIWFQKSTKRKMKFYFKDDLDLSQYCTLKTDIKNKMYKTPKQNPVYLNVQDLSDYQLPGAKFQLMYSINNQKINIQKFVSSSLQKIKQNRKYFSIQSKKIQYQSIINNLQNKHPFIYLPHYIFKGSQNLYLMRPMMIGGKMDKLVLTLGSFKKQLCIFYISQLILALEFLHQRKWVYRATNLSNIYIKQNGYLAIDGVNKLMRKKNKDNQLFYDICGSPEDYAPEMILCSGQDEKVDVWGLGICAYNMIEGHHPFTSYNIKDTFRNILEKKIQQSQFLPNFVYRALQKQPSMRPSLKEIKKDKCFKDIDWQNLEKQSIVAPYIPQINSVAGWIGKLPSIVYLEENKK